MRVGIREPKNYYWQNKLPGLMMYYDDLRDIAAGHSVKRRLRECRASSNNLILLLCAISTIRRSGCLDFVGEADDGSFRHLETRSHKGPGAGSLLEVSENRGP